MQSCALGGTTSDQLIGGGVGENEGGLKTPGFLYFHYGIGDDDDHVAYRYLTGSGPIETDHAGTTFPPDHIGLYPLTVVVVDHLHLLRSEEHTSELQSRPHLVCRLLLEKKNTLTHSASFHV